MNIKDRLYNLSETSTWHCIPNILRSPHNPIKIFWAFCFFVSFSFCSYLNINSVLIYFNYDTIQNININKEISSEFPGVTFCNMNPLKFTKNASLAKLIQHRYLSMLNNETRNSPEALKNMCNNNNMNGIFRQVMLDKKNEFNKNGDLYTIDEMLLNCYYNRKKCEKKVLFYNTNKYII